MTNKAFPERDIQLLGKTYKVKFSLGVLATIEELIGKNPFAPKFWDDISPRKMLILLFALIKKHEPNLTIEELGDKLDMSEMENVGKALQAAFNAAQPDAEQEAASAEKK